MFLTEKTPDLVSQCVSHTWIVLYCIITLERIGGIGSVWMGLASDESKLEKI